MNKYDFIMIGRTLLVVMVLLGTSNDSLNVEIMMIALAAIIMAGVAALLFIIVDFPRRHEPPKHKQPQVYQRINNKRKTHGNEQTICIH